MNVWGPKSGGICCELDDSSNGNMEFDSAMDVSV